jgi:alpha-1,6-mannosyltransferase
LAIWGLTAGALLAIHAWVFWLSSEFEYGSPPLSRPLILLVSLEVLAGVIYLAFIAGMRNTPKHGVFFFFIAIVVGLLLRVSMLFSTPIQEDDYYRYLWDGAVLAHGINPYAYAPREIADGTLDDASVSSVLIPLAEESGNVIHRVNHSHLRTIYPPVAQLSFALAYLLKPWNLIAWRLVLLAFDLVTLYLLVLVLRSLNLSVLWSVVYWWNPLLIREIYNSGHMDLIVLPFALVALLLAARGRFLWGTIFLALAVGVKMWPLLLLPVILRPLLRSPGKAILIAFVFIALVALLFIPVYSAGLDPTSGFTAYGRRWEMNDALYMVFVGGSELLLNRTGSDPAYGHLVARGVVVILLAVWTVWCVRKPPEGKIEFYQRSLLVIAGLFLLSPTQFPWYYVWLLPLLAIRPRWSLLLLTALLPLYYLRFHFSAMDRVAIFDNGIVWVEYAPVWGLLLWEWIRSHKGRSAWLSKASC